MKCRSCNISMKEDWYGYISQDGKNLVCGDCYRGSPVKDFEHLIAKLDRLIELMELKK